MDLFVDADFCGLWNPLEPHDPTNCRSRTGYLVLLGGIPISWKSTLQVGLSLHTMEAEYVALSTAMKPLLHLRDLYFSTATTLSLPFSQDSRISTVFEDNQACLALATTDPPHMTPRSKHIAIKYHWFRSHLGKEIKIQYCPSEINAADIFTKPLAQDTFWTCRALIMGW